MTEERWAKIEGFPDYAVSDQGRVMSLRYNRLLSTRVNSYGNARVVLMRDRVAYDKYVHRLVAEAFLAEFKTEYRIRHRREKDNNEPANLKFANGRRFGQLVRNVEPPVFRRVRVVETGEVFATVEELSEYLGGDPSSIYRVIRGDRRSHKGFTFEWYMEDSDG